MGQREVISRSEREVLRRLVTAARGVARQVIRHTTRRGEVTPADVPSEALIARWFVEAVEPWARDVLRAVGRRFARELERQKSIVAAAMSAADDVAREITSTGWWLTASQTLRRKTLEVVSRGVREGWKLERMRKVLQETVASRKRAMRIARTETTAVVNAVHTRTVQDAGLRMRKQWIATLDKATRPSHMAAFGQVVDASKKFRLAGGMARYPGDPELPPEERINCRCTVVFLPVRDRSREMGDLDRIRVAEDAAGVLDRIRDLARAIDTDEIQRAVDVLRAELVGAAEEVGVVEGATALGTVARLGEREAKGIAERLEAAANRVEQGVGLFGSLSDRFLERGREIVDAWIRAIGSARKRVARVDVVPRVPGGEGAEQLRAAALLAAEWVGSYVATGRVGTVEVSVRYATNRDSSVNYRPGSHEIVVPGPMDGLVRYLVHAFVHAVQTKRKDLREKAMLLFQRYGQGEEDLSGADAVTGGKRVRGPWERWVAMGGDVLGLRAEVVGREGEIVPTVAELMWAAPWVAAVDRTAAEAFLLVGVM